MHSPASVLPSARMGAVLLNLIDAVLACVNKFWHLQTLAFAGLRSRTL
ncbi:hypothetical protein [Streptomyces sp. NPDC093707]